jgi:Skp family chaperone for outer membrane proteins
MKTHRRSSPFVALFLAFLFAGAASADRKQVQAEPNLERRSKLALENAAAALQSARDAYRNGDNEKVEALAKEVQESVELAYASLQQTNKDPRRSPKYFKYAEIGTRDLLRKIDNFQQEMSFADRPVLDKVKEKVQQVHDNLLLGLMEGKKR